jgi:hypothetical protein
MPQLQEDIRKLAQHDSWKIPGIHVEKDPGRVAGRSEYPMTGS